MVLFKCKPLRFYMQLIHATNISAHKSRTECINICIYSESSIKPICDVFLKMTFLVKDVDLFVKKTQGITRGFIHDCIPLLKIKLKVLVETLIMLLRNSNQTIEKNNCCQQHKGSYLPN